MSINSCNKIRIKLQHEWQEEDVDNGFLCMLEIGKLSMYCIK